MSDIENFHLARNDFDACTRNTFKNLQEDGEVFADVTLACAEKQLKAHKVILSACSPFFRRLLISNPHPHPLIYLKGISGPDLEAIVGFIYQGETNVSEQQLDSFLSSAQELQVAGLRMAGGGDKGRKLEEAPVPSLPSEASELPPGNSDEVASEQAVVKGADDKFHCPKCDFASTYKHNILRHLASKNTHPAVQSEEKVQQESNLTMMDESRASGDSSMVDEAATKEESMDADEVAKEQCEECDFSTVHKKNLRRHVQRVHTSKEQIIEPMVAVADVKQEKFVEEEVDEGKEDSGILTYTCDKCETTSRNKWDMSRHILRVHKEMKYLCDICDFKSSKTSRLREHNQKNH